MAKSIPGTIMGERLAGRPVGARQRLVLECANAVAGNEVRTLMAIQPDGSLKRYFNENDTTGTPYQRCSR